MFCLRSSDVISTNDPPPSREDLPSPGSSTVESDTSDYPRSTPSPQDHDSGIGSLEEFSDSKDPDHGLGDELLESSDECLGKRALGDDEEDEAESKAELRKRIKLEAPSSPPLCVEEEIHLMKTALRKETLDRVLNLKNKKNKTEAAAAVERDEVTSFPASSKKQKQKKNEAEEENHQFEVPRAVLRFPSRTSSGVHKCRWEACSDELETCGQLIDHLKTQHASLQMGKEDGPPKYKCLWEGCKVYGKTSCSKSWLEKHIISHGGNKPFQCIVDGCKQRFSTQSLLERHVNSHFKSSSLPNPGSPSESTVSTSSSSTSSSHSFASQPHPNNGGNHNNNSSSSSSSSSSSWAPPPKALPKVIKKAGRKLKYRKTIFSARLFDLFDIGIMAQLQEKLVTIEKGCPSGQSITLTGSIIAKKRDGSGKTFFLMRWSPHNLLEDEWVEKSVVSPNKTVRIASLSPASKDLFSQSLFLQNSYARSQTTTQRNSRKFNPIRSRKTCPRKISS